MSKKKSTDVAVPEKDESAVSPELDRYLRAEKIVQAINLNTPEGLNGFAPIPKGYVFRKRDREAVSVALHAAFELRGGVPALAHWAAGNPDKFYALWSTLQKSDTETGVGGVNIQINSAIPQNPLDLVSLDDTGRVVKLDLTDEDLPE